METLEDYVKYVLTELLANDASNDWSVELEEMYRLMGVPYCNHTTGHLPGADHRWQECPTYH